MNYTQVRVLLEITDFVPKSPDFAWGGERKGNVGLRAKSAHFIITSEASLGSPGDRGDPEATDPTPG